MQLYIDKCISYGERIAFVTVFLFSFLIVCCCFYPQHAHTHTHTHTHTRTHARTHARARARTHAHTHTHTHSLTHSLAHSLAHTHVCVFYPPPQHKHTHARSRTHPHTHTHSPALLGGGGNKKKSHSRIKHSKGSLGVLSISDVFPMLPSKRFQCSSDSQWPSLVLSRKIVECFLFLTLSPPGDRWCDVLGFVPASMSQTRTSDPPRPKPPAMVALPASQSAWSFPITPACPGQYIHRSFRRWLYSEH